MTKTKLNLKGMHCVSCEKTINENLNKLKGVTAKADYKANILYLEYDENKITLDKIIKNVRKCGYDINTEKETFNATDYLKIFFIVIGVNFILIRVFGINVISVVLDLVNNVPTIDENASIFLLFIIGILTSFHCVAMCGGINIAQCMTFKESKYKFLSPNLQYNLGRITSYTIIGGVVGAIGSVLSISLNAQAMLSVIIGMFMILMGINLFGINFIRKLIPTTPKFFSKIKRNDKGPFIVGMLNGFMPCGPLQSIQLYALSTGSFFSGALAMFAFSVGTVPMMYVFGMIGSFKGGKLSGKVMKMSAVLVIVLGLAMITRGTAILGIGTPVLNENATELTSEIVGDEQIIYTELESRSYPILVVKKDVPVKWVINVSEENLNGCNNEIIIREYGIQKPLYVGENVIEFTPTEVGTFRYSCWMGMIRSSITVIE